MESVIGVTALLVGYLLGQLFPSVFNSAVPSPVFMILFSLVFPFLVGYIAYRGVTGATSVNIAINVIQISALVVFSVINALMSNHFHLLCEVPQAQELSEAELLERIQAGYGPACRQALDQQLAHLRQEPDGADQIQRLLQPYRNRLFDLKELKGRFAQLLRAL